MCRQRFTDDDQSRDGELRAASAARALGVSRERLYQLRDQLAPRVVTVTSAAGRTHLHYYFSADRIASMRLARAANPPRGAGPGRPRGTR